MNDVVFLDNPSSVLKESYLTRPQVTAYIRAKGYTITDRFIASLAARRLGPSYRLFGTQAIYTIHDIDEWINSPEFVKSRSRLPNPLIKTA